MGHVRQSCESRLALVLQLHRVYPLTASRHSECTLRRTQTHANNAHSQCTTRRRPRASSARSKNSGRHRSPTCQTSPPSCHPSQRQTQRPHSPTRLSSRPLSRGVRGARTTLARLPSVNSTTRSPTRRRTRLPLPRQPHTTRLSRLSSRPRRRAGEGTTRPRRLLVRRGLAWRDGQARPRTERTLLPKQRRMRMSRRSGRTGWAELSDGKWTTRETRWSSCAGAAARTTFRSH